MPSGFPPYLPHTFRVPSGYGNDPIMSDYAEYGCRQVMPKPYRLADLSKILQEVLGLPERA